MADGIQVPETKSLGLNQHFHKAGEAVRVATTKEEADALASDGWSDKPEGWKLYGPRGQVVTVYAANQEADAIAAGYSLEPPAGLAPPVADTRTPMQQSKDARKAPKPDAPDPAASA